MDTLQGDFQEGVDNSKFLVQWNDGAEGDFDADGDGPPEYEELMPASWGAGAALSDDPPVFGAVDADKTFVDGALSGRERELPVNDRYADVQDESAENASAMSYTEYDPSMLDNEVSDGREDSGRRLNVGIVSSF